MALIVNGTTISPQTGNITFNGQTVKKIIFNDNTVWQKQKKVAATASGSAGHTNGTFRDGATITGTLSFGKTFASAPSMSGTVSGSGHWAEHGSGGSVTFSNITATGCSYKFVVNENPGNNYTYQTYFNWTATGNVWVDDT